MRTVTARVLLIDDSVVVLEAMREVLERAGLQVETAEDGSAGLALLQTFEPDVVVSDLDMPNLNGIDLVRAMRIHAPLIPVIILTDHGEIDQVVAAMREGARSYVLKGTPGELLVQEINAALNHRRLLEDNHRLAEANQKYQRGLEKMVEEKTAEITRLQQLRAQAEKMAAMGTLVAGVAHEINNPISVIISNVSWIESDVARSLQSLRETIASACNTSSDHRAAWKNVRDLLTNQLNPQLEVLPETLKETLDSSQRIARIVASLRRLSHPGQQLGVCQLRIALDKAKSIVRQEVEGRADLVEHIHPSVTEIMLNEDDLVSVIANLVINSAHAMGAVRGKIEISVANESSDTTLLKVRDNGCGIAEENLPRLWDPFYTTKRPGKGMGLGLSLVHQIVRRAGGTLEVESTVGQGTTMSLRLPTVLTKQGHAVAAQ